jgi:GNAT superfamily N-acetyltransferase
MPGKEMQHAERNSLIETKKLTGYSEKYLADILMLEKKCFPAEWQYEDAPEYYKKMLENPENINIFLKEDAETIGYLLARPHDSEIEELKKYDPGFKEKVETFYIETIQVLPKKKGLGGGKKLLLSACEEAGKLGIWKFSIHARTTNGLNAMVKKIFDGKITEVREIKNWQPGGGEPYEYLEWET